MKELLSVFNSVAISQDILTCIVAHAERIEDLPMESVIVHPKLKDHFDQMGLSSFIMAGRKINIFSSAWKHSPIIEASTAPF